MTTRLKAVARLVTSADDCGVRPYVALESVESATGHLLDSAPLPETDLPPSGTASVRHGDVLFGKLRPYLAKTWLADRTAYASTELLCMRPEPGLESRWLAYLACSQPFVDWSVATSDGTKMPRTSWEKLGQFRIDLPSLGTQRAVADYLDRETTRIAALIRAKRRMGALLDERRRALRDEIFVSKPGWKLKRLVSAPMAYGVLVPEFVEPGLGVPMIRTYNLTPDGQVSHLDIAEIPTRLAQEYRRTLLRSGDLILSVVGSMGRAAVVTPEERGFNLNRPLARIRLRPEVSPRLIWHWTQTTRFMDMANLATGGGTAQPTLNLGDLAEFAVGLPQLVEQWPGLLTTLEDVCRRLNEAEETLGRQVQLLQERRQTVITAAVTGQLDIPEAA